MAKAKIAIEVSAEYTAKDLARKVAEDAKCLDDADGFVSDFIAALLDEMDDDDLSEAVAKNAAKRAGLKFAKPSAGDDKQAA